MTDSTNPTNTLMLVGAHHDDNEGNAGGLIARHRAAGWRVISVVMTNGQWGNGRFDDANIEVRNQESRDAAKVLDMETIFMGFTEAGFRSTPEAVDALVEVVVEHRPQVIITHPPQDYHFDHESTSRCVLEAVELCGYADKAHPLTPPRLYCCDAFYRPFEPDVYVDITEQLERKSRAQACHRSQIPADLAESDTIVGLATTRARHRGFEAAVRYAEVFRFVPRLGQARMAGVLE